MKGIQSSDQFGFFSTGYEPPGSFAATSLVAPEAELLSMSDAVGLTNVFVQLWLEPLIWRIWSLPHQSRLETTSRLTITSTRRMARKLLIGF